MKRRRKKQAGCLTYVLILLVIICVGSAAATIFLLREDSRRAQLKKAIVETVSKQEIPYQDIQGTVVSEAQKYYYGKLGEEERRAYLEILQGVYENQEEIYVHSSNATRTNEIFHYVLKDSPDIFWCDGTTTTTAYAGKEPYTVLEPVYLCDSKVRGEKQMVIDAAVDKCLEGISVNASEYDKILYVYEYIVNTVEYDIESEDNQNIYSVFGNQRSVCAGYAKATQYLLEELGVFCTYVTGTVEGGQPHAWNLVLCGENYYYVDTTWGDPVFQDQEGEAQERSYISYDYMCCSDEELFKTHTPDTDVELPRCTKMDHNYYVVNGMYYSHYDEQEALQAMDKVIRDGGESVVLKYADSYAYERAKEDIFDNALEQAAHNLADLYGLEEVSYSYIDDARLNKIVIYWNYNA